MTTKYEFRSWTGNTIPAQPNEASSSLDDLRSTTALARNTSRLRYAITDAGRVVIEADSDATRKHMERWLESRGR